MTPAAILHFLPFDPASIYLFAAMLLLLCVSAMMSASETALFSLSPAQMGEVHKGNSRGDRTILRLLAQQDYMLATILVVNNLVNILIILIANGIIDRMVVFDSLAWEFFLKTILVTFLLLLFGEITPKIYAAYNPLGCARRLSVPLVGFQTLFKPFSWLLIRSSGVVTRALSRKRGALSMDELSNAIEITRNQTDEERQLLTGIVGFVNTDVEQVMKPRVDMVALSAKDDYAHVKEVILRSGFSRIPVHEEGIDHIVGVLYVKDLIPYLDKDAAFRWQELLRKPYFVPGHKKINDLLEEFRASRVHVAIVVDEYGSTVGLVSLEDILEEIVGEIVDESDRAQLHGYQRLDERTWLFEGKMHLNDMLKVLRREETFLDDVRGQAETVAGLLLEVKRDFLRRDESLTVHGLAFTVRAIDGRRIDKVEVCVK